MAIWTPDKRLRVFLSSTLGELADERRVVERAISSLRLTPVFFEMAARPHPPRDLYRAYLAQSDVFIGLYWQSYGQIPAGLDVSGLEEEYELSAALPRLLYVKSPAPNREPRLNDLLSRISEQASYRKFGTRRELSRLVRDDLATLISERFATTPPVTPQTAPPSPGPRALPVATTPLVGREHDLDELVELLGRAGTRLVTLTGPGGIGKTRLAMAVGERLRDRFPGGTVFVPLASVTRPELALVGIGREVAADLSGTGSPLQAVVERVGNDRWLFILDNLEQVIDVAHDLNELLASCPGAVILATSRTALQLWAEIEYQVPPLPTSSDSAAGSIDDLSRSPAIALFVDRARAVNRDFTLTDGNAIAVAEICRRLEGIPLAIELAAARTRLLDPDALLRRLTTSLDALGTAPVDSPERQHTLRATVEWSVGLLDDAERSLLQTVAVFVDGWTHAAAAQVAGLDEDRVLEITETLARHSLVYLERSDLGPRVRMLETICAFVAEELASRPDTEHIHRRHADYYRALAEQADWPMRAIGQREWLQRLEADNGNLAAAVRWYLDQDRAPLPHLIRVLGAYWFQRDHQREVRPWVDQLLPAVDSLEPEARAELLWTAQVAALDVGDDTAARAAADRNRSVLNQIVDPFVRAVSRLAMAWTSPIAGNADDALGEASVSLDELRTQDEPFWTALALGTIATLEIAAGDDDDADTHVSQMRELADRFDNVWLAAWSRVLQSDLAVSRGRPNEAALPLDEALTLSSTSHSTNSVALCLFAFARLAFVDGDARRAASLVGAADGLRRRAGLRAWPILRPAEHELGADVRKTLGAARFDELSAAGAQLNQQDAVLAARNRRGTDATTTRRGT